MGVGFRVSLLSALFCFVTVRRTFTEGVWGPTSTVAASAEPHHLTKLCIFVCASGVAMLSGDLWRSRVSALLELFLSLPVGALKLTFMMAACSHVHLTG